MEGQKVVQEEEGQRISEIERWKGKKREIRRESDQETTFSFALLSFYHTRMFLMFLDK